MDESVKKILIDTIKKGFTRDTEKNRKRKIIFWYDGKQAYSDTIDELSIENIEIIKYKNNSFWIRNHIENEETERNIVIYFDFDRPKGLENDLLDLESFNKDLIFNPDITTMHLNDLNLPEECRNVTKKYEKFFKNQKRREEFKNFDVEIKDTDNIDKIVTAVLLGIKSINEEEILKGIIKAYYSDEKRYNEFTKYADYEYIADLINKTFGYKLEKYDEINNLMKSLVFTYFWSSIGNQTALNKYGKYILKPKSTNVYVFVNSLMRDDTTKEYFEIVSSELEKEYDIYNILLSLEIKDYTNTDAFKCIDELILKYLVDKIRNEVGEYDYYLEIINTRETKYWNYILNNEYEFLKVSINFYKELKRLLPTIKDVDFDDFAKNYIENLSILDTLYRKLYFYYERIEDKDIFIPVRDNVESRYVNQFIRNLSIKWGNMFDNIGRYDSNKMKMQNKFYDNYIRPYKDKKDRTMVIISDAFRYECAKELADKLKQISKKSTINCILGLVPSYTKLGMAALLPNKKISRSENKLDILVDGANSSTTIDRENILKKFNEDSLAIQYEDLVEQSKMEWKKLFSGKKVVYIYHNRIDKTGEHNENDIFEACEKTINELYDLVRDLHKTFSGVNVFITADHGFFYKRGKIESYEKVEKDKSSTKQKDRFSYSNIPSKEEGIISINLNYIFGADSGYVNIPKGNQIYAQQGNNDRYIHGGILPHEILIPVIDFKSTRTSEESTKVGIAYSGISRKITNAITYLDFLQDNNVDSMHKPCRYLLHFEDEEGNRVSDECTIIANYQNTEVKDRFFKEKFVFKNIEYDRLKPYYLVIIDEETGIESSRTRFFIDIAIIDRFDF